jgi:hypothetical protein
METFPCSCIKAAQEVVLQAEVEKARLKEVLAHQLLEPMMISTSSLIVLAALSWESLCTRLTQ